jgi:tetratricopeptide (TPR) repeat protein
LKTKELWTNFYGNITYSYNLARILEDYGSSRAAIEIYEALLEVYPSFNECMYPKPSFASYHHSYFFLLLNIIGYLRLSEIASDQGKFNLASEWLSKALVFEDDEPDVNISLGDLHSRSRQLEDAKKSYEKVCGKVWY